MVEIVRLDKTDALEDKFALADGVLGISKSFTEAAEDGKIKWTVDSGVGGLG